jgi:hypothetical protein
MNPIFTAATRERIFIASSYDRANLRGYLLSELPALPAGYPGTHKQRRAKSAAISFNKPRIVNFLS